MPVPLEKLDVCDPIWTALRSQAEEIARGEPALASFAHATILKNARLEDALSYHLARKIGDDDVSPMLTREIFEEAMSADSTIGDAVRADLSAVFERDPACHSYAQAFLFYKGFHALQSYRIAHWLWKQGRKPLAYFIQSRVSAVIRGGYPSGRADRARHLHRSRDRHRYRRDCRGGRRCVDAARRDARAARARKQATATRKSGAACCFRRGAKGSRQYRGRRIFARWRGQCGAEAVPAGLHRGRRAGETGRLPGSRSAVSGNGSNHRSGFPDLDRVCDFECEQRGRDQWLAQ